MSFKIFALIYSYQSTLYTIYTTLWSISLKKQHYSIECNQQVSYTLYKSLIKIVVLLLSFSRPHHLILKLIKITYMTYTLKICKYIKIVYLNQSILSLTSYVLNPQTHHRELRHNKIPMKKIKLLITKFFQSPSYNKRATSGTI